MAEVVNLDTSLGGYLSLLSQWQRWIIYYERITDPMTIIIRVDELMAGCF